MTKKAIAEFEPSTGSETYLAADAPEQWLRVSNLWGDARHNASEAVRLFIEMGELLLILRDSMPGDLEFGKARKKYVPELSRNDAHRAMGMARNSERFFVAPGKPTPSVSVFAELIHASDDLVEEVIEKTADPKVKSPTVKEVRQKVKAETVEDFEAEVSERAEPLSDIEQEDPEPVLADWFNMSILARIRKMRKAKRQIDHEVAHLVIGINPYYDGDMPLTVDLWALVRHEVSAALDDPGIGLNGKEQDYLQDCIDTIQGDIYDA
ncbi:MAG: hypothetical protein OEQ39_00225 [Gammaproteobacteria bacterium]|nr:hypothetical protein [Gammaproteobacteria bacterium]